MDDRHYLMDDHHFSYITKLMGKIKNKKAPAMVDE
jgi:hypothetical protein